MTVKNMKLPLGMRMNNPGNLKVVHHDRLSRGQEAGFARYDTLLAGCFDYVKLVAAYWTFHGRHTMHEFLMHYAPPTENDIRHYEMAMCARTHYSPLHVETQSLQLDRAWFALDFMRAQIDVEQGKPPNDWFCYPEWINLDMWRAAMLTIDMWKGQL